MSPVTIKRLWTQPYHLELRDALSWGAAHRLDSLKHVLVFAELSDGAVGMAEAPPRPTIYGETPESIAAIIAGECAERLARQPLESEDDIQAAYQRTSIIKNNNTAKGALDIALYSALARSQGVALAQLLDVTRTRTRVSFILGTGALDTVLDEVGWVYEAGVRVLKVKVGADFERETALIQQIKQVYGDTLDLYADANQCYTVETAPDRLRRLADLGVLWCEEPLPVKQTRNREVFKPVSPLPLVADDSAFTLPDLRREINFDTFDILNIKTARTGFSESSAMLRQAVLNRKGVMVGSQAGSMIGCLHPLLFAGQERIDYPTEGTFFLKVRDHFAGLLPIENGAVDLRQVAKALAQVEAELLRRA